MHVKVLFTVRGETLLRPRPLDGPLNSTWAMILKRTASREVLIFSFIRLTLTLVVIVLLVCYLKCTVKRKVDRCTLI